MRLLFQIRCRWARALFRGDQSRSRIGSIYRCHPRHRRDFLSRGSPQFTPLPSGIGPRLPPREKARHVARDRFTEDGWSTLIHHGARERVQLLATIEGQQQDAVVDPDRDRTVRAVLHRPTLAQPAVDFEAFRAITHITSADVITRRSIRHRPAGRLPLYKNCRSRPRRAPRLRSPSVHPRSEEHTSELQSLAYL